MSNQPESAPLPEKKKVKPWWRRGLWWKVPLVLLLLGLILLLLAPAIASTGVVRGIVLGRMNASIPGKLEVDDWSLGWFSGVNASGIKFTDADGRELARVGDVKTSITLSQLARRDLRLGEIVVKGVVVDAVVPIGHAAREAGEEKKARAPKGTPIVVPELAAKLRVEDVSGQVTLVGSSGQKTAIVLDKSTHLVADIPGGAGPATVEAVAAVIGPKGPGVIALNGKINGLKSGPLDLNALSGNAEIVVRDIPTSIAGQIAQTAGADVSMEGTLAGQLGLSSKGQEQVSAKGELSIQPLALAVGKDQFQFQAVRFPVDAELTGGAASRLIVRSLGLTTDQVQVEATADLPVSAVASLQKAEPLPSDGKAHLSVQAPQLPALMNAFRGVLGVRPDVQVTGGNLSAEATLTTSNEGLVIKAPVAIRELAGQQGGGKIGPLAPITLDLACLLKTIPPTPDGVRDLAVNLHSSFLTLDAQGQTASSIKAQGQADLEAMRKDLGAIIDLSKLQGGKVTFNLASNPQGPAGFATDLRLRGESISLGLSSDTASPRRLEGASLLLTARTNYKDSAFSMAEPARLEAAGRLTDGSRVLLDESLQLVTDVSADMKAKPALAQVKQLMLIVGKTAPLVQLALPKGAVLDLKLEGKRGVTGSGSLSLSADLAALERLSARIAPATQPTAPLLKGGTLLADVGGSVSPEGQVKGTISKGTLRLAMAGAEPADRLTLNFAANVAMEERGTAASEQKPGGTQARLDAQVTDLTLTRRGKVAVTEPKLTLGGVLDISPEKRAMTLSDFALESAGGMLALKGDFAASDVGRQNRLDRCELRITPDWSKLWPVIYALLPSAQQAKIGQMTMTGKEQSVVKVSGYYPSGQVYADAIKQVKAEGELHLSQVDWVSKGITASGTIPFALQQGMMSFAQAKPLDVNRGKVYLTSSTIDVTDQTSPRLNISENSKFAEKLQLNQVLVASLGKFASVVFADPSAASGWVDVSVDYCRGLPLSTAIYDVRDRGEAQFSVTLGQLNIDGKGAGYLLGALSVKAGPGQDRVSGEIKNGKVSIANGRCVQKMDLRLGDQTLTIDGNLKLADSSYAPLKVGLPRTMVSGMLDNLLHVQDAEKYLPQVVTLSLSGPASALRLDQSTVTQLAGDVAKAQAQAAISKAILGNKKGQDQTGQGEDAAGLAGKAIEGILGGKRKDKK